MEWEWKGDEVVMEQIEWGQNEDEMRMKWGQNGDGMGMEWELLRRTFNNSSS